MKKNIKKPIVILSLGGSIIVPRVIDYAFLRKFIGLVHKLSRAYRLVIFTGGGAVARDYQTGLQRIASHVTPADLDWVGIAASRLNAQLLVHSLGALAHDEIITDPRVQLRWSRPVWVGAGWKPGRSTDYDAVRIAIENGVEHVVNLSNIDYVYTKDPRQHQDAQKLTAVSWSEYLRMVGTTWSPGLSTPFDPIAAQLARKHRISVIIMNGKKLAMVEKTVHTIFHTIAHATKAHTIVGRAQNRSIAGTVLS